MNKLTTPTKKDEILRILADTFKEASIECAQKGNDPVNGQYYVGRYRIMLDLLNKIKIYREE